MRCGWHERVSRVSDVFDRYIRRHRMVIHLQDCWQLSEPSLKLRASFPKAEAAQSSTG